VIDIDDIGLRWRQAEAFLDERGRCLLAANEALAHGYGGVSAVAMATGLARSTINRGMRELRLGRNEIGSRIRRAGGGRKSAVMHQPDLPAALETLIEDAIRGDPCSPLRWVSRSLRHLVKALAAQGFQASQRVVSNLLRELNYSCQTNRKAREGANHPDRDAQFAHINATVKAAIAGQGRWIQKQHYPVVVQGQSVGDRPLLTPCQHFIEVVSRRQRPVQVLGIRRVEAKTGIVVGLDAGQCATRRYARGQRP
jgi:Rhodopirellula transposase DDE domain